MHAPAMKRGNGSNGPRAKSTISLDTLTQCMKMHIVSQQITSEGFLSMNHEAIYGEFQPFFQAVALHTQRLNASSVKKAAVVMFPEVFGSSHRSVNAFLLDTFSDQISKAFQEGNRRCKKAPTGEKLPPMMKTLHSMKSGGSGSSKESQSPMTPSFCRTSTPTSTPRTLEWFVPPSTCRPELKRSMSSPEAIRAFYKKQMSCEMPNTPPRSDSQERCHPNTSL